MDKNLIKRLEKLMNEESNCRDIIFDREESIPRRNEKIKKYIDLYFNELSNGSTPEKINKIKICIENAVYYKNDNLKIIEKNKKKLKDINSEINNIYDLLKIK